jgi:NADH:quinone reductase (non-electrogenic)
VSRLTERKLARMEVELHLGAMVSDMDDDGVEITTADGDKRRILAATKIWAAGTRASGLGELLADGTDATLDKAGRVVVAPDCSLPGHREVFVVGDLMSLDELPGVAEVAMQSGAHAAHTIVRRLEGKEPKEFRYRDLGTLAAISRFTAVAHIGPVQVGGLIGWLLWLVVHITFLTGFKNRFGALTRWAVSFVGRGRYERALTGRWVAHGGRHSESA